MLLFLTVQATYAVTKTILLFFEGLIIFFFLYHRTDMLPAICWVGVISVKPKKHVCSLLYNFNNKKDDSTFRGILKVLPSHCTGCINSRTQKAKTFLSWSFYACQPNFFIPHKWHTTGVKEVPTYSLAKILPQTVAQDKETNGLLI